MKLTALALVCLAPFAANWSNASPVPQDAAPKQTARHATVIFLRHAEALPRTRGNQNPALAKDGQARAGRWAKTLRAAGVTKVYATELIRTQQTAAPLAKALGLEVQRYRAGKSQAFAESLRTLKNGEVVVVVGHSNTVPQMAAVLGGKLTGLDKKGHLQETEHDRMIVQHLGAAKEGAPMRAAQTLDFRVE